ncbi:hypothetical protein PHYPO_G00218560 [Pangasianodon hypophthalmus]|uniref:Selenoprotein T n=1 Tax=Pangasianodon hypophthalmus TaxID=310915 RepID=A0A5N5P6J7_PANHP|nr:hypothetical protein PHYPO_G00218560 [Pangasianodon hypophthalmus]
MAARCFSLLLLCVLSLYHTAADNGSVKKLKMQYTAGPLLKFQIWRVFEEYTRVLSQRYPDIRIEGENYLPQPVYRHIASFLSMLKFAVIVLIIVGKDPFALFGMQSPGIWAWGQENKVYMTGSRLSKAAVMKVCTESGVPAGVGRMSSSSFLVLWESVMYTAGGVSPVYLEFWEVLLEQSLH